MVSVGQPPGLDVAVTLPQRCGGRVSESCGPERAFLRAAAARIDQFDHSLLPWQFCRSSPSAPTSTARRGVRLGSESRLSKNFLVCHSYLILACRQDKDRLLAVLHRV